MRLKRMVLILLVLSLLVTGCSMTKPSTDNKANNVVIGTSSEKELSEQQLVFKEFWDLYDRYYPSFNRKNINWQSVYDEYYPKITSKTTDDDLFKIFEEIIVLIDDGHTSLRLGDKEAVSKDHSIPEISQTFENITPDKVNIVESSKDNQLISYGTLKDDPNIGYINSKVFMPMSGEEEASEKDFEKAVTNFEKTIEDALVYLKDTDGIIVDVRGNGGGDGGLATHLAGRFFTKSPVEYSKKRIKIASGNDETAFGEWVKKEFNGFEDARSAEGTIASVGPEFNTLSATGNHQYTKPVVVLTSWTTASSGEYFTLAMKTQPHVKTVGNRTCGIFSGSESVTLRSGQGKWVTNISVQDTEFMLEGEFQGLEGKGVSPDYLLIPTKDDIKAKRDIHIEKAVEIIKASSK